MSDHRLFFIILSFYHFILISFFQIRVIPLLYGAVTTSFMKW